MGVKNPHRAAAFECCLYVASAVLHGLLSDGRRPRESVRFQSAFPGIRQANFTAFSVTGQARQQNEKYLLLVCSRTDPHPAPSCVR